MYLMTCHISGSNIPDITATHTALWSVSGGGGWYSDNQLLYWALS
jgi:hypothetical protein